MAEAVENSTISEAADLLETWKSSDDGLISNDVAPVGIIASGKKWYSIIKLALLDYILFFIKCVYISSSIFIGHLQVFIRYRTAFLR
jgi:hypothetical protein